MNEKRNWIDHVLGLVLALTAFIVYCYTISDGAYPGMPAYLTSYFCDYIPRLNPNQPIWSLLARICAAGPASGLSARLNILSALLGSGSIYLLYILTANTIFSLADIDNKNRARVIVAARAGGIAAALFLAFSAPFWAASNRAGTQTTGIFLLLLASWVFYLHLKNGKRGTALLFAFIFGLGTVEFAAFIPLAFIFGPVLLLSLWRREQLDGKIIFGLGLCALAGLSLYFISAWIFYGSEGYELRTYSGYFQVVWFMWLDQLRILTRSLPGKGWLIIVIVTIVPWLTCLTTAKRAINDEKDWSFYILHIIMIALLACVLLNVKNLSPMSFLSPNRLLVTPYLLAAMVYGYLAAYWFLLPYNWWQGRESWQTGRNFISNVCGPVFLALMLGTAATVPLINARIASTAGSGLVNRVAKEIVKHMGEKTWLVTDGVLDFNIAIAAKEQGKKIKIVNASTGSDPISAAYTRSVLTDVGLQNLSYIGMDAVIDEWFRSDKEIENNTAVLSHPDFWTSAGLTSVPDRTIFTGTSDIESLDLEKYTTKQQAYWTEIEQLTGRQPLEESPHFVRYVINHLSRIANNTGVLLEDMGQNKKAYEAYIAARKINPDNISALLNMNTMLSRGHTHENSKEINAQMSKMLKDMSQKYKLWALSQHYGYVRMPQAFVDLGLTWAVSGRRDSAASNVKRAMRLLDEKDTQGINAAKTVLARILQTAGGNERSEALYFEILAEDPDNRAALAGMARLELAKGNSDSAAQYIAKAEKAGTGTEEILVLKTTMLIGGNSLSEARTLLEKHLEKNPESLKVRMLLSEVMLRQNDMDSLEDNLKATSHIKGSEYFILLMKGLRLEKERKWKAAKSYFQRLVNAGAYVTDALQRLIAIDLLLRDRVSAHQHSTQLLRIVPDDPLANYTIGTIHNFNHEYELAEDSFRRSLKSRKTPGALNDLAWLTQKRGDLDEAEKLARESISIHGGLSPSWDTLGVVLMKKGKLSEAESAFKKALTLPPKTTGTMLHLAELHVQRNELEKARPLLEQVSTRAGTLNDDDRDLLKELEKKAGL